MENCERLAVLLTHAHESLKGQIVVVVADGLGAVEDPPPFLWASVADFSVVISWTWQGFVEEEVVFQEKRAFQRDIAREDGLEIEEEGFNAALETHRFASGAGKQLEAMTDEDINLYRNLLKELIDSLGNSTVMNAMCSSW